MKFDYIDKTNKITDEGIIKDLLYVKNEVLKKDTITMKEYFQFGQYGKKAITNHFGTWNNLLDRLGIEKTRINFKNNANYSMAINVMLMGFMEGK